MRLLLADLQQALRSVLRRRRFYAVLVVILALAVGGSAAMFAFVSGVLLQPLPFAEPENLFWIESAPGRAAANVPDLAWAEGLRSLTVAAFSEQPGQVNLSGPGEPLRVDAIEVSPNLFAVLGVEAFHGRTFNETETRRNVRLVLLSHSFWQRWFAGGDVEGRIVALDGIPHSVIGVLPPSFAFPTSADVWVPFASRREGRLQFVGAAWTAVIGRLEGDSTARDAQAEVAAVAEELRSGPRLGRSQVQLVPLRDRLVGDSRQLLVILAASMALLVLAACANIANLLLSRVAVREREIALRSVLGASRRRLVVQLLFESLLIACIGGAGGLVVAAILHQGVLALSPGFIPRLGEVTLNRQVFAFAMALAGTTGILFGLAPALSVRRDVAQSLRNDQHGGGSSPMRTRFRQGLVVAEVALCLVLLLGAGLLVRSFVRAAEVSVGFQPDSRLTAQFSLSDARYPEYARKAQFYQSLLTRLQAHPQVIWAGASNYLPQTDQSYSMMQVEVEGMPPLGLRERFVIDMVVSPDYVRALGIPLLRGRTFEASDATAGQPRCVISQSVADRFFPEGAEALGAMLRMRGMLFEVVGIVGDVSHVGLARSSRGQIYTLFTHREVPLRNLVIQTRTPPENLTESLRGMVRAMDSELPLSHVRTLRAVVSETYSEKRFVLFVMAAFAFLALLLAVTGLYGVMRWLRTERAHEFRVRLAIGAVPGEIVALAVRSGMRLCLLGIGLGLALAFLLSGFLESQLFGISALDATTYLAVSVALALAMLGIAYLTVREVAQTDPAQALRDV